METAYSEPAPKRIGRPRIVFTEDALIAAAALARMGRSREEVAKALAIGVSTMQRGLSEHGTSFSELKEGARHGR